MWESIKLLATAFAIIYGTAYAIGFIIALIKHRREIKEELAIQSKKYTIGQKFAYLAMIYGIIVLLFK